MKKIVLMTLVLAIGICTKAQEGFQKGDAMIGASGNLGFFEVGNDKKMGFGGKLSFEYGIVDGLFGGRGSIGIGLQACDLYGGEYETTLSGKYDYTYTSYTWIKERNSNNARDHIREFTQEIRRKGDAAADCDVKRNDLSVLATINLHYLLSNKMEAYLLIGGGVSHCSWHFSNIHNTVGLDFVDHKREKPSVTNYTAPVYSYYYNDLDHVVWSDWDSKIYPAISSSLGLRYYITDRWSVNAEFGISPMTLKKHINAYTVGSVGIGFKI